MNDWISRGMNANLVEHAVQVVPERKIEPGALVGIPILRSEDISLSG